MWSVTEYSGCTVTCRQHFGLLMPTFSFCSSPLSFFSSFPSPSSSSTSRSFLTHCHFSAVLPSCTTLSSRRMFVDVFWVVDTLFSVRVFACGLHTRKDALGPSWCCYKKGIILRSLQNYAQDQKSLWVMLLLIKRRQINYRGADKSLAWPVSRCSLFDGVNISFDASLVLYVNSTNIPPFMNINRIYEFLISSFRRVLYVVCFLLGNSPASGVCMPTFRNTLFHIPSTCIGRWNRVFRNVGI